MLKRLAILSTAALLATGCASTLDADSCSAIDWDSRAYQAGASASSLESVFRKSTTCAQFVATPDLTELQTSYSAGLDSFCTPARVFETALRKSVDPRLCGSGELAELTAIASEHRIAESRVNEARGRIDRLERTIRKSRNRIAKRSAQIAEFRRELADPATPNVEEIRNAIRKYEGQIAGNRRRVAEARRALPRARRDFRWAERDYRESLAYTRGTAASLRREARR